MKRHNQRTNKKFKIPYRAIRHRCALELSLMTDAAFTKRDKRAGVEGTWVKVKFDRQIVAIAKAFGARLIYSEDKALRQTAQREGLPALQVADIKIPQKPQGDFWK